MTELGTGSMPFVYLGGGGTQEEAETVGTIRVAVHTNHKWIIHLLWGCGGELKIYH